jgi:hypothetical protein
MNLNADWYASLILCKSHPTTEMKSINWEYLFEIDLPVVREVQDACRRMHLTSIMSFNCDWNEEVITQFYSTLYVNRSTKTFHCTIQGRPFYVEYAYFTSILGFSNADLTRERIHEEENVLDDGELHFMYDSAYGIKFGTIHGLTPYYKLLSQLFRYTLCPKSGDSDNISNMSKNLLARMAPNKNEFSVFYFICEEIIICSISPKKSYHYAPYIFVMIKEVTSVWQNHPKLHWLSALILPRKAPRTQSHFKQCNPVVCRVKSR